MARRSFYATLLATIFTATAIAEFESLPMVPVDRLIANTSAYIREHPGDAMGPYTLARIHYLAFATRASRLGAWQRSGPLPAVQDQSRRIPPAAETSSPSEWSETQLRQHLTAAVENFRKALTMNARNGLFHLGLASVAESAAKAGITMAIPGGTTVGSTNGNSVGAWRELAITEFLAAYELSVQADTAIPDMPLAGVETLVSYEAGQHYTAMINARGIRAGEAAILARIQATLKTLANKPTTFVTPIVFGLNNPAPLADLLDTTRTVTFDLDGTGRRQRYIWVRPDTGLLVFDPERSGEITSGHQLFGSVSFNMFWSDGYRALDALDDNRDGVLRGVELEGLGVWFDRNQDGVSQPGEVISISEASVVEISARSTGIEGTSLMNVEGLTTADGRALPTYDWTTKSIDVEPQT